eukprot:m.368393 g.368393  ORF g.368393 m.368393 type:complete len:307 (-) comp56101_c0_seq2:926-1846(-)
MGSEAVSPFRHDLLAGRVAVVTGGGSGIGFEIARQLAKHGAKVVLMGRREKFLSDAAQLLRDQGLSATFLAGDVRDSADAQKVVEKAKSSFGRLDILVNAAAGNFLANAHELSPKGFRTVMEIDTLGVFTMCHAAFPLLKAAGSAAIINITATLHYGATWYQAHASAAKAAIDSLTRSLGLEWGAFGIRVCGIAPGPIADTPGMNKLAGGLDAAAVAELVVPAIPIGRLGTTRDIALATVYLVSEAGSFITGLHTAWCHSSRARSTFSSSLAGRRNARGRRRKLAGRASSCAAGVDWRAVSWCGGR